MTDRRIGGDDAEPATERIGSGPTGRDETEDAPAPTILEQMGGVPGLIYSTLPILVFVPVNAWFGLSAAIIGALATAGAILVYRLIRRDNITPAVSGFIGVAICAYIAHRTGDAKGYFRLGIWTMLVYAAVFVLSIIVRWPLVGVVWSLVNSAGTAWRKHRPTLIAYDLATGVWAVVFIARYLVQNGLYDTGHTGWLAAARIGMGWPLTIVAVLATVWLVRRADRDEERFADETGIDENDRSQR